MARPTSTSTLCRSALVVGVAAALTLASALPARADTIIDGPVNLRAASTYAVLASSTVTNTGVSVVDGDVGLSPGTSVVGFDAGGPGVIQNGVQHVNNQPAQLAQQNLTTAYDDAVSLTPQESGITELNGRSLSPGVYSGGAVQLADTGALAFAGSAESVWVIQAASTLTIGSGTTMTFSGGASACNVFWQVGTSATIGTAAQFRGTVLAQTSITATTGASIVGRLLARTGAVTLDTNTITVPDACPTVGTPSETVVPTITSGTPPTATEGTPYSFTVTASGNPAPTYTVTAGTLPAGLTLDSDTGVISGTPTTPGDTTVTITADNGQTPPDSETYPITTTPAAVVPPAPGDGGTPPGGTTPPTTPGTPGTPGTPSTPGTPTTPAFPVGDRPGGGNGPSGDLAYTGSDTMVPALGAGLALLLGGALVVTSAVRRRRRLARIGS